MKSSDGLSGIGQNYAPMNYWRLRVGRAESGANGLSRRPMGVYWGSISTRLSPCLSDVGFRDGRSGGGVTELGRIRSTDFVAQPSFQSESNFRFHCHKTPRILNGSW
jgi:hypothetical protein